jgi:hypothetical protein
VKTIRGRYYFGRVIKSGILDHEKFLQALQEPISITKQKYSWTIRDFRVIKSSGNEFYFGYLTKFLPEGLISKLDRIHHTLIDQIEPDMIVASSPFIYMPKYSGIVYLHLWNQIQQDVFVNRFSELVVEKYEKFFVSCEIEAITDLRSFYKKISELSSIERINATIHPPNPLFGRYWKSLKDYLEKRNTSDMKIEEKCDPGKSINNELKKIIKSLLENKEINPKEIELINIGDAAILMAADGYGHGKVEGIEGKRTVIISTRETKLSILFDKDPDPIELKNAVEEIFKNINKERHMDH